ncbi:MAG: Rha family transcriptional regulator, partial [Deltaproteobacteria bacterium]
MTSREIAELSTREHKNVLRDIDNLVESLGSELSQGYKSSTYIDINGVERRQYVMDKDAAICLVSGYDPVARMKIIKRWQELEAKASLPDFTNPVLAARAWADEMEKR